MKSCLYYRSSQHFKWTRCLAFPIIICATVIVFTACNSIPKPPSKIKLPIMLREISGLHIDKKNHLFYIHNDSGDQPNLYVFDPTSNVTQIIQIAAQAKDWEDITTDDSGNIYIADVGNNKGMRKQMVIYRYAQEHADLDSIVFTYPNQNGLGREISGNYNCEAIVYTPSDQKLHLFTKALTGVPKSYWSYHFSLPATPGNYTAQLVDSLYFPRRVITAASLDSKTGELLLTAYNYKRIFGFFPAVASSIIRITDYPGSNFFSGEVTRRNLSWAIPTQYEAIDFYDDQYIYVGSEKTKVVSPFLKRIKRSRLD